MKIWIFIGRFNPPHKWHLNTIKKSLKFNDLTIVILGSANVFDKLNPFDVITRWQMIEEYFENNEKLILESIDDVDSDKDWVSEIWDIINIYNENLAELSIYWWDFENDSAINVLKEFEGELWNYNKNFVEFNRYDHSFKHNWETKYYSSTLVRECLEKKDHELLKQLIPNNILKKIS